MYRVKIITNYGGAMIADNGTDHVRLTDALQAAKDCIADKPNVAAGIVDSRRDGRWARRPRTADGRRPKWW